MVQYIYVQLLFRFHTADQDLLIPRRGTHFILPVSAFFLCLTPCGTGQPTTIEECNPIFSLFRCLVSYVSVAPYEKRFVWLWVSLSLPFPLINEGLIRMRARDRSVDYNPSTLKFLSLSPTERESIEREKGKESRKK